MGHLTFKAFAEIKIINGMFSIEACETKNSYSKNVSSRKLIKRSD
jgi:predicted outer membrane protein